MIEYVTGEFITCSDCGGEGLPCDHLKLHESTDDSNASWYFECFLDQTYNYPNLYRAINGTWEDDNSKYSIGLISSSSADYLEPNSKLVFESEANANDFFSKHIIHNNQIDHKRFYVFPKDHNQYDQPLPVGIKLSVFEGDIF